MENPASLMISISNIYKHYKGKYQESKTVFRINLVIFLIIHLIMMYQLFYKNVIINFFDHKSGYAFFIFYFFYTFLPIDMILVELGIWKKSPLDTKLVNYSIQLLESDEKRHSKPNKITKLEDEVVILNKKTSKNSEFINSVKDDLIKGNKNHTDFVKMQFEPVRNLTNKNAFKIISSNNKISDNINSIESVKDDLIQIQKEIKKKNSKIETIKILTDNSNNSMEVMLIGIKKIFKNYKNLFKNLDVDNFIAMVFKGENKNNILVAIAIALPFFVFAQKKL